MFRFILRNKNKDVHFNFIIQYRVLTLLKYITTNLSAYPNGKINFFS